MKLATTLLVVTIAWTLQGGPRAVTPETFAVESCSYRTFGFEVSRFGRVFGEFHTTRRSEIRVLVLDQDQFENYRTGHEFGRYYDSVQVSEGEMDLQLRYGRYVLIFDNRSSPYSNAIASDIQLDER